MTEYVPKIGDIVKVIYAGTDVKLGRIGIVTDRQEEKTFSNLVSVPSLVYVDYNDKEGVCPSDREMTLVGLSLARVDELVKERDKEISELKVSMKNAQERLKAQIRLQALGVTDDEGELEAFDAVIDKVFKEVKR